jgi:DnaJ-class molecular chaperone
VPAGKKTTVGDLLVTAEVVVPESLTDEQRSTVETLAGLLDEAPRDFEGV